MVISEKSDQERQYIVRYAKDLAGTYTDEKWKMLPCTSREELMEIVQEKVQANMICVDITEKGMLEVVKELRRTLPAAYMILIASTEISPLLYMRPTIGAQSLMLKPLSEAQIQEVLKEAIRTYAAQFYKADEREMFIVESGGERSLIDYDRICFFEARDKRVYLNTESEEYGFYDTLEELTERLGETFLRCHRSFLVNTEKIEKILLSRNTIELSGQMEIPLSRSYKPAVKQYLRKMGGNSDKNS